MTEPTCVSIKSGEDHCTLQLLFFLLDTPLRPAIVNGNLKRPDLFLFAMIDEQASLIY